MRYLKLAVIAVAGVYLAAVALLAVFQRSLMYLPDGAPRSAPSSYGLDGVREVLVTTADGLEVAAWYVPAPPNRPTVVLFHGNAGSLRYEGRRLQSFREAGIGALLLSYRGYSGNPGTPSEQGLYADARAALDWLRTSGVADGSIVLYGISLGSGVATKMAAERELGAVVLEAPYTSTVDVAAVGFPLVPVRWLMFDRFESLGRIAAVTEPLLIVHGDRDSVIPQRLGRLLFDSANEPKEGLWLPGIGHDDVFDNGGFEATVNFIERTMSVAPASSPRIEQAEPTVVHGLYNWVHSTADAERAFAFYRDVFGIELAPSPFIPGAAAPEGIRPWSAVAPDPIIWDLTATHGSRARTVFMRAPNTAFGLELSEFIEIERQTRAANPWDPGASRLIFHVRDLDAIVTKLTAREAPIVTLGAAPVLTGAGRAVLVRDPDGYLVEIVQASANEIAIAGSGEIIATSIGLTVADTERALELYRGLLGFEVRDRRRADIAELALYGLSAGQLAQTVTVIPGTATAVLFTQFSLPPSVTAEPFRWRIQDVGSPQFQLEVRGLDALIERTTAAGYRFLSVGARPIERPFGRFVFAIDADQILVEYAEPNAR